MWRKIRSIWVVALFCLTIFYTIDISFDLMENGSAGNTLYVDITGAGGAYTSIQEAIDAADPGDTVSVYRGTYFENIIINKTINLYGEDRSNTIIDGGYNGDTVLIEADSVNIMSFTVTRGGNSSGDSGIQVNSDHNTIRNNNISGNGRNGISNWASHNEISNNILSYNRGWSFFARYSSDIQISGNSVSNSYYGIDLLESSDCQIVNNIVSPNCNEAIVVRESSNMEVSGNQVSLNVGYGIMIWYCSPDILVSNNNVSDSVIGIEVASATDAIISDNEIFNTTVGISLQLGSDNYIRNNNIIYTRGNGINIRNSEGNDVIDNKIFFSGGYGIRLAYSSFNKIYNTNFKGGNIFLEGSEINDFNTHTIPINNSVDGYPIYYYKNRNDLYFDSILVGGLIFANCENVTVKNMNITHIDMAIEFAFSHDINIIKCNLSNNLRGIYVVSSSNSSISNSTISYNALDGLWLTYHSTNNKITNSNISFNGRHGIDLRMSSNSNIVDNILLSNKEIGISVTYDCVENDILRNDLISNGLYGIKLTSGSFNRVFHNNFINNSNQSVDYGDYNIWNNSYPYGGNYWSDYNGTDNFSGPDQDMLGSDFIGDEIYNISWNNRDYYPLIEPYPGTSPPRIQIISPKNNSIIKPGTDLQFFIFDWDLNIVNYSIDGGNNQDFQSPYIIQTHGWSDGIHRIRINANDSLNNFVSRTYNITIDSIKPFILLNSPLNNSLIPTGYIINFSIIDINLDSVNFSVNGGSNISFSYPFEIDTSGWIDDDYMVNVTAIDLARNSNSSWYNFSVNSSLPIVDLLSPLNNSVVKSGTIFDFSIIVSSILEVNYSINGGDNITFEEPYNISSLGWADGTYIVQINTINESGNTTSSWFCFIIDSSNPIIDLNTPTNNSFIMAGTIINFSVTDPHIKEVNYSINGASVNNFTEPYDLNSSIWPDGDYTILINAVDQAGNTNASWFYFSVDSTKPIIILESPQNKSFFHEGKPISFSVVDLNLYQVNYTINDGFVTEESGNFNISTTGWDDGEFILHINANDLAGNQNSSIFLFTIDNTDPEINLNTPLNNSIVRNDTILNFNISDKNLVHVNYSVNEGLQILLIDPYNISTIGWSDGNYSIQINTLDLAGNSNCSTFFFTIDNTLPEIILISLSENKILKAGLILDFDIIDINLDNVNCSINGGSIDSLTEPYNVSTHSWQDGNHTIFINAIDMAGNSNSSLFSIVIDSTKPEIKLNNPGNNTIHKNGIILDFKVDDPNLSSVNYSVNSGESVNFTYPYNISTFDWPDGNYTVQVKSVDLAGNINSSSFLFIIDSTDPEIILNHPENNSVVKKGIILNFTLYDLNLLSVNYSINGGANIPFSEPYNIPTSDWQDGNYLIQINAIDKAGNTNSTWYTFTIDSTLPMIELFSPQNNTVIKPGTPLYIKIYEPHFSYASYFRNNLGTVLFSSPFNISTVGWQEGNHNISIGAYDLAGNSNSSLYFFIIDSTPPELVLDSTLNHSTIPLSEIIKLYILGDDLDTILISIDDGIFTPLPSPYEIDTLDWNDGLHKVTIFANDTTGNNITYWFEVTVDAILPFVLFTDPDIGMDSLELNSSITITFNEPMNKSDIGNYLTISPHEDLIYQWNQDGTVLTITSGSDVFIEDTYYELTLSRQISDINGNQMDSDFQLTYTTKPQTVHPDPPAPEFEFPYWILGLIGIIALILISLVLLIRRRGESGISQKEPPVEFGQAATIDQPITPTPRPQFQAAREISQGQSSPIAPQAPQPTGPMVTCPRCQNPFSIDTTSVPYRMVCPHCGAKGKVERA